MTRILGIDPGLTRCGIGVVDFDARRRLSLVHVDVVRSLAGDELAERLRRIADGVDAAIDEHAPDRIVIERVFAQHNVSTVMGIAQISGAVLVSAARRGIPVAMHTPSEVKAAVTGYGSADKTQVGTMVKRILRLDAVPKPADAADAIALAICSAWKSPIANAAASNVRHGSAASPLAAAARRERGSRPLTPAQEAWLAAERRAR